jgi:hypothetical protein
MLRCRFRMIGADRTHLVGGKPATLIEHVFPPV